MNTNSLPAARLRDRPLTIVAIALGIALVAVQGALAWDHWRRGAAAPALPGLATGALCSVMLSNGQVYYGEFVDADARHLRLHNVYYVQTAVDPSTNQPANRLVNRRKADWHAPQWMSVPVDKVVMVEAVSPGSRLAELIEVDRKSTVASR